MRRELPLRNQLPNPERERADGSRVACSRLGDDRLHSLLGELAFDLAARQLGVNAKRGYFVPGGGEAMQTFGNDVARRRRAKFGNQNSALNEVDGRVEHFRLFYCFHAPSRRQVVLDESAQ